MAFLKNCWYVAAWQSELIAEPVMEEIIGKRVLLYRYSSGRAVALGDTCSDRFAPLHKAKIAGDLIECTYHGLRFGADGRCAFSPFDQATPPAARTC